ncbi:MAG: Sec-independent protein translocase protein TatB [Gammaproteobacteria bacterium]
MFDAGFSELLLIFVIALLILGPERLPRVAAQLGRWIAKARRTANQLRWQLEREVALDELYRAQPKRQPSSTSTSRATGSGASGSSAGASTMSAAGSTGMEPADQSNASGTKTSEPEEKSGEARAAESQTSSQPGEPGDNGHPESESEPADTEDVHRPDRATGAG